MYLPYCSCSTSVTRIDDIIYLSFLASTAQCLSVVLDYCSYSRYESNRRNSAILAAKMDESAKRAPPNLRPPTATSATRSILRLVPHRGGLVVSVSALQVVGCGFAPNHKNGTNCLPAWHASVRVGVWQCSLTV